MNERYNVGGSDIMTWGRWLQSSSYVFHGTRQNKVPNCSLKPDTLSSCSEVSTMVKQKSRSSWTTLDHNTSASQAAMGHERGFESSPTKSIITETITLLGPPTPLQKWEARTSMMRISALGGASPERYLLGI